MYNKYFKPFILISSFLTSFFIVFLFYKASLGINFFIFNIWITLLFIFSGIIFKRLNISLIINSILLLLLSITYYFTNSIPVRIFVFIPWLYFFLITIHTLVQNNDKFEFFRYITVPIEQLVMSIISPLFPITKTKLVNFKGGYIIFRVILGLIVAVPIFIVFLILFVRADLMFKEIVTSIFSEYFIKDSLNISLIFLLFFWLIFGVLYYNLFRKDKSIKKKFVFKNIKSKFLIESVTILSVIEFLFLVFNGIQTAYLFGGEKLIKNQTFTYSEYARKGFFELIIAGIIALLLISFIYKLTKAGNILEGFVLRIICFFGILELIPMSISAFYRLYLYESAYGFTELRIYSHIFILFLLLIFISFCIKFLTKIRQSLFLYTLQIITLITLIIVGVTNVDSIITTLNINKYNSDKSREIDLYYLYNLSDDNIPALVEFFKNSNGDIKEKTAFYLESKYASLKYFRNETDIRGFNLREYKALHISEDNINEIDKYSDFYQEDAINKSKTLESEYENHNNYCYGNCNIFYINMEGDKKCFESITFYSYEDLQERYKLQSYSDDCIIIDKGKYLVVVKDYNDYLYPYEFFFVDISNSNDDIYLVSRKDF